VQNPARGAPKFGFSEQYLGHPPDNLGNFRTLPPRRVNPLREPKNAKGVSHPESLCPVS